MFDIVTIKFLLNYMNRPMQFFGRIGLCSGLTGFLILGCLFVEKLWGNPMLSHGPLLLAGALLILAGVMLFSTGLLGEMIMRTYFESQGRRIYAVREIRSRRESVTAS